MSLLLGNGDGTFQPLLPAGNRPGLPISLVAGDFTGDGLTRRRPSTLPGHVSMLLGNGDGTFQPPMFFAVGQSPNNSSTTNRS